MLYNWVSISSDSLHFDLSMLPLKFMIKTVKRWPIQDSRGLFEGNSCCTSHLKATCMHQSLFSGGTLHIGYSLELCLVFGKRLNKEWPWTGRSSNSLQFDLSMLPSKFVVNTLKNCQYKTAGDRFEGNLGVKANCMHRSRFSSAASHIGYSHSKLCQSLVFRTKFVFGKD